ncbi:NAD(P)/FAD-dependent oxidoreductase [Algihabitans albus]|uniref:NAD(P)/FAD-dependent oxidoreductase n=1 Tax=Algihabitans albus TaxID=2164067 RepID=UPI0013C335B2|nr:FAD-dependent oxidoreductase [Algihabitans albus]
MSQRTAVIVGAGQAGARTAAALRKQGWQDRILLLGAEEEPPYERPPLSKQVLTEDADPNAGGIYAPDWYADEAVELRVGCRVESLDPAARRLRLADGGVEGWDVLVLATGCEARRLSLPGAGLDGVVSLRTAADARALRSHLRPGADVVLIGGGFIGLEVAASARRRGCNATLLEMRPQLLERALPARLARYLAQRHRREGVDLRLGVGVAGFEGDGGVRAVRLSDGTRLPADLVVVGVGGLPNVGLARAAGLPCDNGIRVDGACRVAEDIYAVGDCACFDDSWSGRPVRLESWENAELAPQAAAKAILGGTERHGGVPWFWTDQYDLNLQLLGLKQPVAQEVLRGDPDSGSFCLLGLVEGRVTTAALVNAGRERRPLKRLIEARVALDPATLADIDRPLRDVVSAAT